MAIHASLPFLVFVVTLIPVLARSFSDADSDLVGELVSLRSSAESGVIRLNDHLVSRFLTSVATPRPYSLLIFFDAVQLHSKHELKLQELRREFGIVSASFAANNNGPDSTKLFFCEIEFSASQASFQLFAVNALPHIRLVGPDTSNLRDNSGEMDQGAFSRLAESMAEFAEHRTKLTVGPIRRSPLPPAAMSATRNPLPSSLHLSDSTPQGLNQALSRSQQVPN